MKPQTAKQLTDANRKAIKDGKPTPYTKQQHAAAEGCDHEDKRYWNRFLNGMEAYTKKEYTDSEGSTFLELILWNRLLPDAEPFTKQEYSDNYGRSAKDFILWNECLPDAEQFNEDEINKVIKANRNEHTT